MKDYYKILGVSPEADEAQIKSAYRRLALRYHPDRNPGDPQAEERFKEITEAYGVLIDRERRRQYDRYRQGAETATGFSFSQEDIFRDLFHGPYADIFRELSEELARHGFRMDERFFQRMLFSQGMFITGMFWVFGPRIFYSSRPVSRPPERRGLLSRLWQSGRRILDFLRPKDHLGESISLRLTPQEAARGAQKTIHYPTSAGTRRIRVTVPPGVKEGTRLRLKDKSGRLDREIILNITLSD